jgi:hypothetical protein
MVLSLTRQIIQKTLDAGREVLVGGNFDPVTLKSAAMLPATGLVLHHHELPSLLPGRFESYRDLDVVSEIRSRTALALRNRVHER